MPEVIVGPSGFVDEHGDSSGAEYVNEGASTYSVCSTAATLNNADTSLVFTGATTVNHLFMQNNTGNALYCNPFASTTGGPLILVASGAFVVLDWRGMTPHLLTPAGIANINSATPGAGIVLIAGQ